MTQFTLDELTFEGFGVPETVPTGGAQRLGVHQMPGGIRVIDAMGPDDLDIAWTGTLFSGEAGDAVELARYLDRLRKQGNPVALSFDAYEYIVIVESFKGEFERYFQIPYAISCKVVEDLTNPVEGGIADSLGTVIGADWRNALAAAQNLGMVVPSSIVSAASSAIGAVNDLAAAITFPGE